MGKYQAYSEYKDTDIEWFGLIPSHWVMSRIKFASKLNPSKSEIRGLPDHTEVTFLPMEAIGEDGRLDTSRTKKLADVLEGYSYVADGDVMIAKITPCFENGKGAIAAQLRNGLGFATTEVIVIRPDNESDSRFLYYLLSAEPFRSIAEGSMYGAGGQKRVADSFVANYSSGWPSSKERVQIAAFLDHETAKIDRLIAKQQRLIELLKEKRQVVISHAVTKGLNPDAPMKDSGVEWLGEVPAHWDIVRIARLFIERVEYGRSDLPILSVSIHYGVTDKELPQEESDRKLQRIDNKESYKIVAAGDLVYNMMRAWQGAFGAAKVDGLVSPAYVIAKPIVNLCTEYFEAVLRTGAGIEEMRRYSKGITDFRLRLYWDEFRSLRLSLPPKQEQEAIVAKIQEVTETTERIIEKAGESISLMKEHRIALISAAVTGKIDVRGWRPPDSVSEDVAATATA